MPHLHFSAGDRRNANLFRRLRWSLGGLGVRVTGGRGFPAAPPRADAWFVAPWRLDGRPLPPEAVDVLRRFPGPLVDYSMDDDLGVPVAPWPPDLRERLTAWCRVAWPAGAALPAGAGGALALLPPFLPRTVRRELPVTPVSRREMAVLFVGSLTGDADPDRNSRVRAARLLRAGPVPFVGGVFGNVDRPDLAVPADVRCARFRRYSHLRRLSRVAFGLALPGNNPLTYRFVECLAAGALCFSPDLGAFRWLPGEIRAGEHYVAVADDLADLPEKLAWYAAHPAAADALATAGHAAFRTWFRFDGLGYNARLLERFLAQFPALAGRRRPALPLRTARALVNGAARRLEPLKELEYAWKERRLAAL